MIQHFVKNGRLIALTVAVIIVAGLGGLSTLPRSEDPRITGRLGVVNTFFPGASAERVEALISEPLENKLRELSDIKRISSVSSAGISVITIELKDRVDEKQKPIVWSRARDLLREAQTLLPANVSAPELNDDRGFAYTLLYALTWQGQGEINASKLGRYAKELESRLRGVPGTELVGLYGLPQEEILVEVDTAKLASVGLSTSAVAHAVQLADSKVAAGQLQNQYNRMAVEVAGELTDLERIRRIPLRAAQGLDLRLGDVSDVYRQEKLPASNLAMVDKQRSVVVGVRMLPDRRVDDWTHSVEAELETFMHLLPANVGVKELFNQNDYTGDRLGELFANISLGFVIILVVLFFTLGLRSALIVAAALPLTMLFTLAAMKYYGLPIHQMSITGLIVALGIMVDNAIVMVDSIARERARGAAALEAVKRSVQHLWMPLLGSTLTTILAFMPIVLMPGAAGEFVSGIALSVIFALVGSYLISFTVIAGLAGRYLKQEGAGQSHRWWQHGIQSPRLSAAFERSLVWSLKRPGKTLGLVLLVPLMGFVAAGQLTEQFFPTSDRDMFHVEVYLPQHSSIDASLRASERISTVINQYEDIQSIDWFVGANAPSFYYNMMENRDGSANYAQAMIRTSDFRAANRLIPELQNVLDDEFPELQILVRKLEQGPPVNAPVEFRLYGPNLDVLRDLGDELRRVMLETPDVTHSRATLAGAVPKIWFNVDEELGLQSGLALRDLSGQLQNSLDGVVQGSVLETTQSLPIRIRASLSERKEMSALENINFVSPLAASETVNGKGSDFLGVPLSAIGRLNVAAVRGAIPRRNGQRVNTVQGFVRDGVLPAKVSERISQRLAEKGFTPPPGYRLELGGEGAERNDAVGKLLSSVGVILILLILVVVLSFNSFRLSGIIFAVAIQAAGLGLLNVFLFGYPFGFTVIIGLLGLIGLAINAAIVILAELKADESAVLGNEERVVAGVINCSRHIGSTTITTMGGFLPLILAGGGFWPPFAIAIAGGTLLTTLVSFYFVPAAFLLFAKKRAFEQSGEPAHPMPQESIAAAVENGV
jgi:multidrug efflux pump subunit AcrB